MLTLSVNLAFRIWRTSLYGLNVCSEESREWIRTQLYGATTLAAWIANTQQTQCSVNTRHNVRHTTRWLQRYQSRTDRTKLFIGVPKTGLPGKGQAMFGLPWRGYSFSLFRLWKHKLRGVLYFRDHQRMFMRDLRISQRCCWRFKSSGMLYRVDWQTAAVHSLIVYMKAV